VRLLHTADWHIGQTLHNFERFYEHQCFLDWLLDQISEQEADALLVSGDVFDNANPSAAAQKQLYSFLKDVKERSPHLNIVIIAGNHDSPGRLEAPSPLLKLFDTVVIGHVSKGIFGEIDLNRIVVPLKNREGRIAAWCLAVPFLRPGDVPRIETEGDPYTEGIELLYCKALDFALSRREPGQAIIALGHCHMIDGQVSADSERKIVIGGAEALPAGTFGASIAYAALGHLHRAQAITGQTQLRYSGSPIPMSFAEIGYTHQIIRIDLDGESVRSIETIRVPRFVELIRVPESPGLVTEVLQKLEALTVPDRPDEQQPYLEVRVQLDAPEPGLRARVEAALSGKPVRLVKIETTSDRTAVDDQTVLPVALEDLDRLHPDDMFKKLYRQKYREDAPESLLGAFAEVIHEPAEERLS
jgi:exonuclease SbcD